MSLKKKVFKLIIVILANVNYATFIVSENEECYLTVILRGRARYELIYILLSAHIRQVREK